MIVPELIRAGDERVLLGYTKRSAPLVDIRIVSEENYQYLLKIIEMVRQHDVEQYLNGTSSSLLPHELRRSINDVLTSHGI